MLKALFSASGPALSLLALMTSATSAADSRIISGVEMGASLEALRESLGQVCEKTALYAADAPRYPLAERSEATFVCTDFSGGPIGFEKAAFVVADNRLVQVEALGVDLDSAQSVLGEPDGVYLDMNNYSHGTLWLNTEGKRLFWLSEAARHPNLFAWHNPHLSEVPAKAGNDSTRIPSLLNFEASLDQLRSRFEAECEQIAVHENERVWLPNKPDQQVQIDCFGFPYAGFERKLEAVFGDGKLQVIWVLTGKPEESRLRARLIKDWGQPSLTNESWEVFGGGRISLYKDKPEFLILSDEMIPLYEKEFTDP
jgi:hypothetical protein